MIYSQKKKIITHLREKTKLTINKPLTYIYINDVLLLKNFSLISII